MKTYIELLKDIRDNGHDHPDRTGVGRRSIFGRQVRFNMSDGFPLVTTRKIFFRGMKEELLWFIAGEIDNTLLNEANVHIWDNWAVTEKTVDKFMEYFLSKFESEEDRQSMAGNEMLMAKLREQISERIGSIGPLYGFNWRHAPADEMSNIHQLLRNKPPIEDIPSDKVEAFKEAYKEYLAYKEAEDDGTDPVTETDFIQKTYVSKVDQLGILLAELKNNPYSSRLVVSSWLPQFIPDNKISPDLNVLLGMGALAPCHVMFQCFVQPALNEGGKKRLNLLMFQR
jgi:thymidylate synthase